MSQDYLAPKVPCKKCLKPLLPFGNQHGRYYGCRPCQLLVEAEDKDPTEWNWLNFKPGSELEIFRQMMGQDETRKKR